MTITLPIHRLLFAFYIWWLIFFALVATQVNDFQILTSVGFVSLVCVPGLLTIIALRLFALDPWTYIGLTVGFGLLELMFVGLIGNTLLPFVGIARPLEAQVLISGLSIMMVALAILCFVRVREVTVSVGRIALFTSLRDALFAYTPAVFPLMSIVGARTLNEGGSNAFILSMLAGVAIYSAVLIRYSSKLGRSVIPTALFFITLALLLMTSLRGSFVTGHDIQREYSVFQLTKSAGLWSIMSLRDAYNACMSITIVPTIFSNLLSIADPYVYKALFQILFAIVPGIVYMTAQRYVGATAALLSALYFIAFPTFFTDMPFLNRQEIAFIFLSLMVYVIFDERIALKARRLLFAALGLGMVLSHYSTTYTVIALLAFVVAAGPIVQSVRRLSAQYGLARLSTIAKWNAEAVQSRNRITLGMLAALVAASFLWSSVLTDTSSNSLYRVVTETIKVMRDTTREDAKSSDVLYSLFSWKQLDANALLKEYEDTTIARASETPAGTYYESARGRYPISLATPDVLPLTRIGRTLSAGIDVPEFNYAFRQSSAKLIQILVVIGFVVVLWSSRFCKKPLDSEFVLMGAGSLILLAAIVVLPVLSVEYGLLRAFQQSLVFLSIFIVIGSLGFVAYARESVRVGFAGALTVIFLLSSTGVFTQLLGGYDPQLHLNNSGIYYDRYYVHASELKAIEWLAQEIAKDRAAGFVPEIQSDTIAVTASHLLLGTNVTHDINPAIVRTDAYVFLGVTNVKKMQATVSYGGTRITYIYPMRFLDDNKKLIYDEGGVKIYR